MKEAVYTLAMNPLSKQATWFYGMLRKVPVFVRDERIAKRFDDLLLAQAWADFLSRYGYAAIICIVKSDPKLSAPTVTVAVKPNRTRILETKPIGEARVTRWHF
jgi:hypothetical protein